MNLLTKNEIDEIQNANKKRLVKLPDGTYIPALGQGTWYMGESFKDKDKEIRSLRLRRKDTPF